jgi:hypothetical protein
MIASDPSIERPHVLLWSTARGDAPPMFLITGSTLLPYSMAQMLADLASLPVGSHCVSFYAGPEEAANQAVRFLAGSPWGMTTSFWVDDPKVAADYNARLSEASPEHVGCVIALGHEQVERVDGKLRPAREIFDFFQEHPEGVSAGGDTLSLYWTPANLLDHLEYEEWFQTQPRDGSRFLCPYDLRRIPLDRVAETLGQLRRLHSHIVLSQSPEPAVRLLQLLVFGTAADLPPRFEPELRSAQSAGLIRSTTSGGPLELTAAGREFVRAWIERSNGDPVSNGAGPD